jgi:beta-phosphoglucomutase-like phosphatase (HAD superfamily)
VQIEAVLFDIDGTLVDSNEQHVIAWGLAFHDAGHPQEDDTIRGQIGKGGDLLVPALAPDLDDTARKAVAEAQGAYFKSLYLDRVRPFPSAAELVDTVWRSGRKVVLASSAKRTELDHYVGLLGVGEKLAATTSIDDVETSKPAPDIFGAALEKIGVLPGRAMVVGDTPYDVEAAIKAGIACTAVTSGPFDAAALRQAGAVAIYADVAALLAQFDRSPLAA